MHSTFLQGLAPVLSGCVLQCYHPSQLLLMRAEEQQKQMELPVGLWEDSGRARTAVWEELVPCGGVPAVPSGHHC